MLLTEYYKQDRISLDVLFHNTVVVVLVLCSIIILFYLPKSFHVLSVTYVFLHRYDFL